MSKQVMNKEITCSQSKYFEWRMARIQANEDSKHINVSGESA